MGTSCTHPQDKPPKKDHPHACGDKPPHKLFKRLLLGSSPRVWGQVTGYLPHFFGRRIIPTRVGTRVIIMLLILIFRDHPHACGDKNKAFRRSEIGVGSSPRVWGQVFSMSERVSVTWIIPTRVGTRRYIQRKIAHS